MGSKFKNNRNELRIEACKTLAKIQNENRRIFNKKRKKAKKYREGDLVPVK